jgi:hypothetical protein
MGWLVVVGVGNGPSVAGLAQAATTAAAASGAYRRSSRRVVRRLKSDFPARACHAPAGVRGSGPRGSRLRRAARRGLARVDDP